MDFVLYAGWQLPRPVHVTLEVISNLAFLAHEHGQEPDEVREYTTQI